MFIEMSEVDILRIIATGPRRYKIYGVPKRDGIGTRIIAQPARELKAIQRYTMDFALSALPVHSSAMAYVAGKNIAHNATAHVLSRVLMKLDFKEFFHSLVYKDLERVLLAHDFSRIPKNEWAYLENILFWLNPRTGRNCLSIGAPSSPDDFKYYNGKSR
jgi:RNA-directed DNA polymerase